MPALDATTGQLFVQVERQPDENWLLCCFHALNATKVTLRLSTLEDSLHRVVPQESWHDLLSKENTLTFNGQVAPPSKKKQFISRPDPPQTEAYVAQSFKTLFTPTPRRNADDMEVESVNNSDVATPAAKAQRTVSYAAAIATSQQQPNQFAKLYRQPP